MSTSNESRWWEFYGIRYAMGTVVGALIIHFIFSTNKHLQSLLFLPKDPADFGGAHLALLAAYGLAFCYIASGPVLIMHMARAMFWAPIQKKGWRSRANRLGAVLAPALIAGEAYWFLSPMQSFPVFLKSTIAALFGMVLALQAVLLTRVFQNSSQQTIRYYRRLIERRERPSSGQYVESYRHLREHGNSFLIVFFEFWLGLILFAFVNTGSVTNDPTTAENAIRNLFIVVFLWSMPASIVWFFGNKLEHSLVCQK